MRIELRSRGEPITLFGERPEDRRDRLRQILYSEQQDDEDTSVADATPGGAQDDDEEEVGEFYIEGSQALLDARRKIARYSLPRAAERVRFQRIESTIPVATHVKHRNALKRKLDSFELFGSQIASERPVSLVRFAPKDDLIAVGDWAGSIKIVDVPNLETKHTFRGHKGMIGGIDWLPGLALPSADDMKDSSTVQLASGGGEGSVLLWNMAQETPIASLNGHSSRVVRTVFHPSRQYLASASYDTTWRLWDLSTQSELLLQEGHSKEVYTVAFNQDGSLLASAGLDSIGRVWDLRTGRTVMLLEGHVAPVYAVDWNVDGVRCVTGMCSAALTYLPACWKLKLIMANRQRRRLREGVGPAKSARDGLDRCAQRRRERLEMVPRYRRSSFRCATVQVERDRYYNDKRQR